MLAETQIQLQSAQHSVLFLQSEHAKVIAGLHDEIRNLQAKCSALTFQLAMSGGVTEGFNNDIVSDDREPIRASQDIMQKEIASVKEENIQLKGVIETRDKRISLLEGQLKSKEQKYQNDLKLVQRNIAEMKSEMDAKSNTIAYLTTQLHQLKIRGAKPSSDAAGQIVPSPPRGGTPNSRIRALRRTATSPTARSFSPMEEAHFTSHQVDLSELPLQSALAIKAKHLPSRPAQSISNPARPALGHSTARREREIHMYTRPKPSDYKDFISAPQKNYDSNFVPKPPAAPLPPISASKSGRQPHMRSSKEKGSSDSRHTKISGRGGEITEVVVEPLGSPERTWRKVQDSKYRE